MRVLFMCVLRKKDRAKTVFVFVCVCGMWIHVHCASERTHDYANAVFRTGDYLGKFIRRKTKMEATLRRAEKNCWGIALWRRTRTLSIYLSLSALRRNGKRWRADKLIGSKCNVNATRRDNQHAWIQHNIELGIHIDVEYIFIRFEIRQP